MGILNKSTHIPIYIQIKEIILDEIRSGKLKPEQQILSESNLAELYGVNRLTARSAITQLVNEGFLVRVHGRGTFVKRPIVESSSSYINNFLQDMMDKGYSVRTELLSGTLMPVPDQIQSELALGAGEKVHCLRRRRSVNNEFLVVLETYLPAVLCPDLLSKDLEGRSLYEILRTDYKLELDTAQESLEARIADPLVAGELSVEIGAPILFSIRRTKLGNGNPIEFTDSWYRGDRYSFEVSLKIKQTTR